MGQSFTPGGKNEGKTEKIPAAISDYIKKRFESEFLTNIKTIKDKQGGVSFQVDVSKDNTLYHLRFNPEGILVESDDEPLIELYDEGDGEQ